VCHVVFPPPTLPSLLPWMSVAADVGSDGVGRRPLAYVDAESLASEAESSVAVHIRVRSLTDTLLLGTGDSQVL
jgi:hypothetical protein